MSVNGAVPLAVDRQKSVIGAYRASAGRGNCLTYGFYPGWQYWISPDRSNPTRLPRNWDPAYSGLAILPAFVSGAVPPVQISTAGVEACRLRSAGGDAIVLLNWTDRPLTPILVTLPEDIKSVSSAALGPLKVTSKRRVSLPLKDVDVLLVRR